MENKSYQPSRKITTADGTIMYMFDGKLHNWDGPALIREGVYRQREYYIYGVLHTEDEWKEVKRDKNGVPWYKNPSMRESIRNAG